jgi:ribonuclease R
MLVGERTGEAYGLGDRLRLKLVDADIATGGLLFEIVDVIERVERHPVPRGRRLDRRTPRRPVAHRGTRQDKRSRGRR